MDLPFLGQEARAARAQRSQAIADEVYQFFKALAAALPYLDAKQQGVVLPENAKIPAVPATPEILEELDAVERWGLPNPGTWLDQSADYLEDIEAARRGRERYQEEQEGRTPTVSSKFDAFEHVMANAEPLIGR